MMSCAIPEYRLPRQPLFLEIDNIKRAGVEIRCNQTLGKDFTLDELFDRQGFQLRRARDRRVAQPPARDSRRRQTRRHQRPRFSPRNRARIVPAGSRRRFRRQHPRSAWQTRRRGRRRRRGHRCRPGGVAAWRPRSPRHVPPHRRRHAGDAPARGNRRRASRRHPVSHAGQPGGDSRRRRTSPACGSCANGSPNSTIPPAASRSRWNRKVSPCRSTSSSRPSARRRICRG